jgi:hypothetical protein
VVVSFHALVAIAALTANRPAVRTRLWPGAAVAAAGLIIKAASSAARNHPRHLSFLPARSFVS